MAEGIKDVLNMKNEIRAHVFISGKVQGVFYRSSCAREAGRLGLRGWVRNLPDERVEAIFEGNRTNVEGIISWCRRGPKAAKVEGLELEYGEATGEFEAFEIK